MKQRSTDLLAEAMNLTHTLKAINVDQVNTQYKKEQLKAAFDVAHREAEDAHALSETLNSKYQ